MARSFPDRQLTVIDVFYGKWSSKIVNTNQFSRSISFDSSQTVLEKFCLCLWSIRKKMTDEQMLIDAWFDD